jgi:hypothetical protein
MFLKSLDIINFKSFYDKHCFEFKHGVNIIYGECGSGKTNLCRAVEFALFGGLWGGIEHPINFVHNREQKEKDKLPSAEVTLEIVVDEELYLIERSISISDWPEGEKHYEDLSYDCRPKKRLTRREFNDYIYINEGVELDEHDGSLSAGQRTAMALRKVVARNLKLGYNMVLLDNAAGPMTREDKDSLYTELAKTGLDQLILLESNHQFAQAFLEELKPRIFHLGRNMESLVMRVENFPFPSEKIRDSIEYSLEGYYIHDGDAFERAIYDHPYTLRVLEANPGGCRFGYDTRLTLSSN